MKSHNLRLAQIYAPLLMTFALSTTAFAGSQTEPGRTTEFTAGPVPEGFYFTNISDYGQRSTNPTTTTFAEVPDFFWSTPWRVFGANLAIDVAPTWFEVGQNKQSYVNGFFNPYFGAVLGWDLGNGFNASYTIGGYTPLKTDVAGNFGTFEQRLGLSYLANGWNVTGRFIVGLPGTDHDAGRITAPDYLNFDWAVTRKFGKWEAGLIGFASTDLNRPFAGYAEQSQVALGALVAYDFGPVTVRLKGTRTISQANYGGYDTRVWTDVAFALWTPPPAAKLITK